MVNTDDGDERTRPARRTGRPRAADRPPGFTRAALLSAAADVFAEKGYEKASMKAIAARADLTSAAIYRHFDGKVDLLLAVVEQAVRAVPLAAELERCAELSSTSLARLVSLYAESSLAAVRSLVVEIHAAAARQPEVRTVLVALNERIHQDLVDELTGCVAAGRLPAKLDVERTAGLMLVVGMGLAHLDTFNPALIGDDNWIAFIESAMADLLDRPTWPPAAG